ncbi:type II toxin-antitoxin system VapC family toxin [Oryzibacter oryziterrae]|uniref:type II toxin-antitoxin system VapC family toxin n=1 Tax=Oryzibacter oryziterrae TaxID=2766474 RepID=UPI001F2839CF|nr:type II toxin-antitoxin system VapC family toxin [Oryzibacter oryziterrae]
MIVLDTNVISELSRDKPDANVLSWVDSRPPDRFLTTSISVMEMRFGLAIMPAGRKRTELARDLDLVFNHLFAGRVLPFDTEAAVICARIRAERRASGRPLVDIADAAIAAIALARQLPLATRNLDDFAHLGLDLINPWDMPAS